MSDNAAPFRFSARKRRTHRQPIGYLIAQAVDNPDMISLAAGLVDYDTLPTEECHKLLNELLSDRKTAEQALQYGMTGGLIGLQERLLEHLAELDGIRPDDMPATFENVVITTGSQQMLFLLSDILIDPGDIVITAWPSYFVYTGTLESMGAEVRAVDMDDEGIIPESLEEVLGNLKQAGELHRVKIVYVQTYHQNPTGLTLAADRRPKILDIVRRFSDKHRILILEDAAYRELTYEGTPPPSIKSYDKSNEFVALTQTFSKPFAPGVKTGYTLLPDDLVEPVMLQKGNHDFGSVNLCQHLLLAAIQSGLYHKHLDDLRRRYITKRNAMLAALDEHLGNGDFGDVKWARPTGGLYVYLTFPESIDTGRDGKLFARALEEGVLYLPGEFCFGPDPTRKSPHNTMRLCYGKESIEKVVLGVERLATAVKAVMTKQCV